jgi:hypothetical protein
LFNLNVALFAKGLPAVGCPYQSFRSIRPCVSAVKAGFPGPFHVEHPRPGLVATPELSSIIAHRMRLDGLTTPNRAGRARLPRQGSVEPGVAVAKRPAFMNKADQRAGAPTAAFLTITRRLLRESTSG